MRTVSADHCNQKPGVTFRLLALSLFLAGVATAPAASCAAERPYYMWVDEDGVVNFSQEKPRGRQAREIQGESAPRIGSVSQAQGESKDGGQPSEEEKLQFDEATVDATNAEARKLNCAIGKRALAKLHAHKYIYMQDEDGWWRKLSPDQYQAQVEKANNLVTEYCPGS